MSRASLGLLLLVLISLFGSGAPVAADELIRWRLGPDDFVNYRIEVVERSDSRTINRGAQGAIDDVAGFHGYELQRHARRVQRDVTHAQLLYVPFVFTVPARALRGYKTEFQETLGGTWRMRPFHARGQVTVTAGPRETHRPRMELKGRVTFRDADEPPPAYRRLSKGLLEWTAVFDIEHGRMDSVTYELSWATAEGSDQRPSSAHSVRTQPREAKERIELTLDRVYAYRYRGFQGDVDRAIGDGLDYLESRQRQDGSWGRFGPSALALLALVDGGRPADHPCVRRGLDFLLRQTPWVAEQRHRAVYGMGVALMAIERLRTPPEEVERRHRGIPTEFLPRKPSGLERAWMSRCVGFLLDEVRIENEVPGLRGPVTGEILDERWRWGYGRVDRPTYWDNSNSQYAVLGLESAQRCGIPVPRRAWIGIANHFMAVQAPRGRERRDLMLEHLKAPEPSSRGGTRPGTRSTPKLHAESRGWHYREMTETDPGRPPTGMTYGAMTAAGIGSLAIARSRLAKGPFGRRYKGLLDRIDQSILDGFASLDDMFTVWMHPRYEGWYTYYLYALERAGMLTSVRRVGGHDWYWEGAMQLLMRQSTYGQGARHWRYDYHDVGTTSWAILFLKRGTPPVITPR